LGGGLRSRGGKSDGGNGLDYCQEKFNKHIRKLENEIRRDTDTGGSVEGVGDTTGRRASDYAAVVEQIKGIAAKQESAFNAVLAQHVVQCAAQRELRAFQEEQEESFVWTR